MRSPPPQAPPLEPSDNRERPPFPQRRPGQSRAGRGLRVATRVGRAGTPRQGQHDEHHGNRKRSLHTPAAAQVSANSAASTQYPTLSAKRVVPTRTSSTAVRETNQAARPRSPANRPESAASRSLFPRPSQEWPAGKDTASEDPPAADRRPIDRQTGLGTPTDPERPLKADSGPRSGPRHSPPRASTAIHHPPRADNSPAPAPSPGNSSRADERVWWQP